MTQVQVMASEGKPGGVRVVNGQASLDYDSMFAGLHYRLIYFFSDGKLARAKFLFDGAHDDLNPFIADYHTVGPALREKYGKPADERVGLG
jgi:hypothetical protein